MEASKKHLRDTALKLFAENGFSNVSVREISNAAGMSNAMLNYYFGTKEALLNDILADLYHKAKDFVESLEKSDEPVMEKIRQLVHYLVEESFANLFTVYVLFQEEARAGIKVGQKDDHIFDLDMLWLETCVSLVNEAVKEGSYTLTLTAEYIYYSIIGTIRKVLLLNRKIFLDTNTVGSRHLTKVKTAINNHCDVFLRMALAVYLET